MGVRAIAQQPPGVGPRVYKVGGEVYHATGGLDPEPGQNPQFAQLYVYDNVEEAANYRSNHPANSKCIPALMRELSGTIHYHHEYSRVYKQIWTDTANQNVQNLSMVIRQNRSLDPRVYNRPTGDELALIVPGQGVDGQRDILVKRQADGRLERIQTWNPAYACLHYVLLFPFGEHGFQRGIPFRGLGWLPGFVRPGPQAANNNLDDDGGHNSDQEERPNERRVRTNLSELDYYSHILFPRETITGDDPTPGPEQHFGTIFRARKLFHQFLVDIWAILDQARLLWLRLNQNTIRADLYRGVVDALVTDDLDQGNQIGTILPSSYYGGARQMAESYQDAMAIARHLGPPQFFVTMTANPNWPEIQNALLPGQTAHDRPDLACRVFDLKRAALLEDLKKNHIFGRCTAHVYTIEFQKRGLPHMHLLVWVDKASHMVEAADIDDVISAELPDPTDQELYDTVTSTMLHGPCTSASPCWDKDLNNKQGGCSKGYLPLKPFQPQTTLIHNSYPHYRRRDNGRTVRKQLGGQWVTFDNRSVVPYSPYLSRRYNCHINVEHCSGINAIKYIFKYVFKGRDRVSVDIIPAPNNQAAGGQNPPAGGNNAPAGGQNDRQPVDEIRTHLDGRWISAYESLWRIFAFSLHKEVPNIYRLPVHLEGEDTITFRGDEPLQDVVARRKDSKLMAFFKLNRDSNDAVRALANSMVYQEIPSKFTWQRQRHTWKVRQNALLQQHSKGALGRMYFVSPKQKERFYLRLLLTVVKGPTSYDDLKRYGDRTYDTFQAACVARGITEDNGEWSACLTEAANMKTGFQLRKLFVVILTCCSPDNSRQLWVNFREHLCDDLGFRLRHLAGAPPNPTNEQIYDYGLYLIQEMLEDAGTTMQVVGLDTCVHNWGQYHQENRLILEQIMLQQNQPPGAAEELEGQLNANQREAFEQIYNSAVEENGQIFFLDGPAGTGKTFLYKALCYKLRSEGHFVLCVASSDIASLLLPGGRTSHSRFHILININQTSVCGIKANSDLAKLLRRTKLIIWDEVPMQHKHCAEAFERTCRDILAEPNRLFGGLTVVFGGDFRQILPVVPHGTPEDIIDACLKRSYLWPSMQQLRLTENMRLQGDPEAEAFAVFLLDVGRGSTITDGSTGPVNIDPRMRVESRAALIDKVYPDLSVDGTLTDEYLRERTLLAGRNDNVLILNKQMLQKFPGVSKTYYSADTAKYEAGVDNEATESLSSEFLNSLNCAGIPLSKLELKVGCPIMILRNLAPAQGICNGTRAVIVDMKERVLEVRLLTGSEAGNTVFVPRITLSSAESDFGFVLDCRQFPVRLAFAMTINKSQGQSVKYVGLDFEHSAFTHGQLYVVLSRCTSASRISVFTNSPEPVIKNVVFKSVLSDQVL